MPLSKEDLQSVSDGVIQSYAEYGVTWRLIGRPARATFRDLLAEGKRRVRVAWMALRGQVEEPLNEFEREVW